MVKKEHCILFCITLTLCLYTSNCVTTIDDSNSKYLDIHCKENTTCVRLCTPGAEIWNALPPEGSTHPFSEHHAINITFQREDGSVVAPDMPVQLVEGNPLTCELHSFIFSGYILPNGYFYYTKDTYYFTPQEYCLIINSTTLVGDSVIPTVVAVTCDRGYCPKNASCVRKCCTGTKVMKHHEDGSSECIAPLVDEPLFNISLTAKYGTHNTHHPNVYMRYGMPSCFNKALVQDRGHLLPNGKFESIIYNQTYHHEKYCLDILRKDDNSASMQAFTCYRDYCKEKSKCVRKCCTASEIWSSVEPNTGCTEPFPDEPPFSIAPFQPEDAHLHSEGEIEVGDDLPLHLLFDDPRCRLVEDKGYILRSGNFYSTDNKRTYDHNEYCVEMFRSADSTYMQAFTCWVLPGSFIYYYDCAVIGAMIVSTVALTALIIWHAASPPLRDLAGKCLLCHVISLDVSIITYLCLEFWLWERQDSSCLIVGILLHSSTIATFLWLTVMCYDVWRSLRQTTSTVDPRLWKMDRFVVYSVVAWGLTLVYVVIISIIQFLPDDVLPYYIIRPVCVNLKYDYLTYLVYYGGIICVLSCANMYFVFSTIALLYKNGVPVCGFNKAANITENPPLFQRTNYLVTFWQRFQLFVMMTLLWPAAASSHVLSPHLPPWQLWAVILFLNKLQGLLILVIFIRSPYKRKLVVALMKRCLSLKSDTDSNPSNTNSIALTTIIPQKTQTPPQITTREQT